MPEGPLITAADLRDRFDIDTTIKNQRIDPHIRAASKRLRKWVGDENYNLALDPGDNETADLDIAEILKNAEAHLAMHFAIVGLNSPVGTKGVFITETSTEGKAVRRWLSPSETAELSGVYLELAREIAGDYLTDGGDAVDVAIVAEDLSSEGSTRSYAGNCC